VQLSAVQLSATAPPFQAVPARRPRGPHGRTVTAMGLLPPAATGSLQGL